MSASLKELQTSSAISRLGPHRASHLALILRFLPSSLTVILCLHSLDHGDLSTRGTIFLRSMLDSTRSVKYVNPNGNSHWRKWCGFARRVNQHPFLPGLQRTTDHVERSHLFLAFAGALRDGQYGNGRQASGSRITETLRWCALFMFSRNLADPRRASPGQHSLDRCISSYLEKCKEADPPSQPQQALPNTSIRLIALTFFATQSRRLHVVADLVVLAFFFLLRVGEYTPSSQSRRTIPLAETDVKLWRGIVEISHDSTLEELLTADGVTICLQNQKNGHKNALLHHYSSRDAVLDPVKSVARLVHSARACARGTSLGTFHNDDGRRQSVSADEIRATIRLRSQAHRLPQFTLWGHHATQTRR
jgi:hypothetical protein